MNIKFVLMENKCFVYFLVYGMCERLDVQVDYGCFGIMPKKEGKHFSPKTRHFLLTKL